MESTIDRVFKGLFPERANESLDALGKVKAILDHCNAQKVGEDATLKALCEISELQFDARAPEGELLRTKWHIEEILGVEVDWEEVPEIHLLCTKGISALEIAARLQKSRTEYEEPLPV